MNLQQIIKDSELQTLKEGWLLVLPDYEIDDYAKFKKQIAQIGGRWKTGKGFYFENDPTILVKALAEGMTDYQKLNDFFPTPEELVEKIVNFISLWDDIKILEPSAGRGAFMKAISKRIKEDGILHAELYYCEIDEYNAMLIEADEDLKDWKRIGSDFLKLGDNIKFDLIVANPPFKDDKKHLVKMASLLNKRGSGCVSEIYCILPEKWGVHETIGYVSAKAKNWKDPYPALFQPFEEDFTFYYTSETLGKGAFRKSGANIDTIILIVSAIDNSYLVAHPVVYDPNEAIEYDSKEPELLPLVQQPQEATQLKLF